MCGAQRSILGAWLDKCIKGNYPQVCDYYQSDRFVCVSVTRGLLRIVSIDQHFNKFK